MNTTFKKVLLASASFAFVSPVLMATPAFAQSTATQAIESVTVSANASSTGVLVPITVPKERATLDQAFLNTQPAGQSIFESLNLVPGYNFTNNDPYGNSGGDVRIHGFDGARISFTWDGMPLNDTGNYSIFTNQVVDAEDLASVTVNQGTTDADSPTASAVGGVIAIRTTKPKDELSFLSDTSYGSFGEVREFARVDSGTFGPWDTRAFASYSYSYYDKWKGPGYLQKRQYNFSIYQDLGELGWFQVAGHYNENRNNFYNTVSFLPSNATTDYNATPATGGATVLTAAQAAAAGVTAIGVSAPVVAYNGAGSYVGVGALPLPTNASGYGLLYDEASQCVRQSGAGTQFEATSNNGTTSSCTGYYNVRINPSDTGNIRISSLFHLTDNVSLTIDPSIQYVLANGGGITPISETDPRLRGSANATGVDLNKDGDTADQISVYTPNNTNTIRYGLNTSLLWQIDRDNTLQAAYTLDYGLHRQTAQYSYLDANGNPYSVFGGYKDAAHRVLSADGTPLRGRDRRSRAILNQFALDYEGNFFDNALHVSAGVRAPMLERDLNQLCYVQATGSFTQTTPGTGFQYCTSQTPIAANANNTFTFAQIPAATATFTAPGQAVVKYNRLLPSAGLAYTLPGTGSQFFVSYAQGLSAPRTDSLYNGGNNGGCTVSSTAAGCKYSSFAAVKPETTENYDIGYRLTSEMLNISLTAYNNQFKNRIVTTFDATQGISVDHNVGSVNLVGVDAGVDVRLLEDFTIYNSVSYEHSRVAPGPLSTIPLNATGTVSVSIANKELVETPDWTITQRYQYKWEGFTFGFGGKYVGRRYGTDTNDYRVPSYVTANMDISYDLADMGWAGSYIKFNASNLFNEQYFGSISTTRTCFTPYTPTTSGCTSYPSLYVGAPQTFQVTLRAAL